MAGTDKWEDYKREVLDSIDAEAFYETVMPGGIKSRSGDEHACLCFLHEDSNPSASINVNTKFFNCQVCDWGDSLIGVWAKHKGISFKEALLDLGQQSGINPPQAKGKPPIDAGKVAKWHDQLMSNGCPAKRWLNEKRGLHDETLVRFKIGWDGERNTIPVHDHRGNIVNVRRYNAKNKAKMINFVDGKHKYGSPPRLYGAKDLIKRDCEEIFITEGEWDRILMEQHGFPSVTGTHGAKTFRPEWGRFFTGRKVRVVRKGQDKKEDQITVDVLSILEDGKVENDVELQQDDLIIVPEKLINW